MTRHSISGIHDSANNQRDLDGFGHEWDCARAGHEWDSAGHEWD
jgi:hypothetical protein